MDIEWWRILCRKSNHKICPHQRNNLAVFVTYTIHHTSLKSITLIKHHRTLQDVKMLDLRFAAVNFDGGKASMHDKSTHHMDVQF